MNDADRFYRCLGDLLATARRELTLSVPIVALLSGVSAQTIRLMEGGVPPSLRNLCAVAKVLVLDPADLLRRAAAVSA